MARPQHYDESELNQSGSRGGIMVYLLEFLGLLAVAFALAASPLLVKVLQRFFSSLDEKAHTAGYGLSNAPANDRAEVRDEIRRMTSILESSHLDMGHQRLTPTSRR
jgi:hypothetical protein